MRRSRGRGGGIPGHRVTEAVRTGVVAACAIALIAGCDWSGVDVPPTENVAPSIRITGGAAEGGVADYRVEFYWFGSDPDGVVSFFQYAIDDTCLCRYAEERSVHLAERDTTVTMTERIALMDPDSCRARGIEPAYDSPDSIWRRIDTYSGTFEFPATTPTTYDPNISADWHRFFVRAVDDRGAISEPDSRYFNAVTIAPTVSILSPVGIGFEKSRTVSPFVTVRWNGHDDDSTHPNNKPRGYQLKMVELDNIYVADDLVLRYLTSPFIARPNTLIPETLLVAEGEEVGAETYEPTDWWPKIDDPYPNETFVMESIPPGNYAFAVRAVDQAGAVTPGSSLALVTEQEAGAVLKLDVSSTVPVRPFITIREENILGEHLFIGDGEEWRVEVPINTPLRFRWSLDTSHYGARPAGTNYAIDISDPGCEVCQESDGVGGWIGWGGHPGIITDLYFTEDQAGEQHILYVRGRDESFRPERETLALVVMDVVGFSFEEPVLWIDDFKVAGTDDCTHDDIMRSILEPAVAPYLQPGQELPQYVARPRTGECQESSTPAPPKLSTLSRYQTLIWPAASASAGGTALGRLTDPSVTSRTGKYLAIYMRAGGRVIIWGRDTAGAMLGDFYPQDNPYTPDLPLFENPNFGPGTFLWDVLRMRTRIDVVERGTNRSLRSSCSGIIGMEATPKALAEGFPAGKPDPTGYDPSRSAIWFDEYHGAENPFGGLGANGFLGLPALSVSGLDTLYTYVSNSWTYAQGGAPAIRSACGTAFLSPFEGRPVAIRYDDPAGFQGRSAWILTPLHYFSRNHREDLSLLLGRLVDWLFMVN